MDENELITKDELKKFKEISRKDYGVELTDKQAFEQAAAIIMLFEHVLERRMKKL